MYENSTHDLVVVPVNVPTSPTAVLNSTLPAAFTPDGNTKDDAWTPSVEVSKPATWALTVRDSAGTVVNRQSLGAGTSARFTWDGKNGTALVADGAYAYTITATPADGIGNPVSLSGSVALRARAVPVSLQASTFSSDVSTNGYSSISWSSAALPPYATGYNVNYRQVTISSTGNKTYGATKVWLKNTKAKTGKLYVPAGAIYQVSATVADTAPIKAPKPVAYSTTASLVDDRSLSFSSGWTSKSTSSAYKGTSKYASSRGKTATGSVYGSTVRVVGAKCKACGSVTITVDGKSYPVSTNATSTKWRQTWWTKALKPGRHTVKVTVGSATGRSAVWLDGIGATG
jgi:hypothetical protein